MEDLLIKYRSNFTRESRSSSLTSCNHSSVQTQIHARLMEAILNGNLEPGRHLLQDELAAEMSVSRMPIREALLRLEADGLVDFHPYKGFSVVTFTIDDLKEIYFLRGLLEGAASELAAVNIKNDELEKMGELCQKMESSLNSREYDEMAGHNACFHQSIYMSVSSSRLYKMIVRLWNGFPKSNISVVKSRAELILSEHIAIYDALCEHSSEKAGLRMREHLSNDFATLVEYWNEKDKN